MSCSHFSRKAINKKIKLTWMAMCSRFPHNTKFFLSVVNMSMWCCARFNTQWKFGLLNDSLYTMSRKNFPTKFELTGKTIKQTNDSSQIFILLGFSCIYIPRHFFSFPPECRWSVSLMASYASATSYHRDHTQSTQQINSTTICHGQRMHRQIKINTDWSLVIFI